MKLFDESSMNAPWGLESRKNLVVAAGVFFDPVRYVQSCEAIGKTPASTVRPFSLRDFLTYLEKQAVFPKSPNAFRVMQLLKKMVDGGLLHHMGKEVGGNALSADRFIYLNTVANHKSTHGAFWLTPVLGCDFLYHLIKPGIVQITGRNKAGDSRAGTGLIVDSHHILTCRHVVCDMKVDCQQTFQGVDCAVESQSIYCHNRDDVAVIRIEQDLEPVGGMVWQPPVIGQTVYVLGYPRIPQTSHDSPVTLHPGAVTSESVQLFSEEIQFLYSAVSRPGNSGGPIVSETGYVIGMVSKDLTYGRGSQNDNQDDVTLFAPHYAGVPSDVIVQALKDMQLGVQIPFEEFE